VAETLETGGESVTETSGESTGQSETTTQTTDSGTGGESFFDYDSIKGTDLEPAYKEMQRAFTKRNAEFSAGRDKITQYDQFMSNPVEQMRALATQYGYQMVQGDVKADDGTPKTYNNWDEVKADFKESIRAEVMQELNPMFNEVKSMKKQNVEQSLDNSYPDWRTYEDSMMETLQAHPSLVSDPDMLYRMSVPQAVLDARANKAALKKIQGTNDSGQIQGQSTTTQQTSKTPGKMTFNESVNYARQQVRRQGLSAPRE